MRRVPVASMLLVPALLAFGPLARPGAAGAPPDFVVENAAPGAGFDVPTAIAFFPDGRLLVTEKAGRAWVIHDGVKVTTPMWDARPEVLDNGDRGLVGVAVDPHYALNHFVYFAYVVDPDSDGVDDDDVAFGRVVRFRTSAADSDRVDPASRTVLIGTTWADGVPSGGDSHTIDALRWGLDGSLLVSAGEGALYATMDAGGLTPDLFLPGRVDAYQDIGSFRAQSLSSYCGKVLRIDPSSGRGYASNPYYDGNLDSRRSKIYAYGLRNPWRFTVRPGTGAATPTSGRPGTLYVGHVGLNQWEAIDIARQGGTNFGWPCWEGPDANDAAVQATPAHDGCDSYGTADNPAPYTAPTFYYHHYDPALGHPAGTFGNGVIGGVFYTGAYYPSEYRGAYFYGDLGGGWVRAAVLDTADQVVSTSVFLDDADGPVDFATDPKSGDLYYVSIYTNQVRHVRYTGPVGTFAPVAVATGTPTLGVVPMPVSFSSAGTYDPEGAPVALTWNFGDGAGSTLADPVHTFTTPGVYHAILTADDGQGGVGKDTVIVVASSSEDFPTTSVLDDFNRPDGLLGPSWTGGASSFHVSSNALVLQGGGAWGLWGPASFGSSQEAFVTFVTAPESAGPHNLYLKVQAGNLLAGCIRVSADPGTASVTVATFEPGIGWVTRGGPYPAPFAAGDRFGARAYVDGSVQVFRNGERVGTANLADWRFGPLGGAIGLELTNGVHTRLDDFGGGDAVIEGDVAPNLAIISPANGAFYAAGDSIPLRLAASDDRDAASALQYRWDVDLNHNNHVHPDVFSTSNSSGSFLAQNHDDGTGVSYSIRARVTDTGGLSTTASVRIWPEVDLQVTSLSNTPDTIRSATVPVSWRFTLRNGGRMPAPISRWRIVTSGGSTIAEGDTVVPGGATITIVRTTPPPTDLSIGTNTLRVVADTLGTVHEVRETNNARTKPLVLSESVADAGAGPASLALSAAFPNPGRGAVGWTLDLAAPGDVTFAVFDLQGREVWRAPRVHDGAGRRTLVWPGLERSGRPARAGLYLARVEAGGRSFTRRFVLLQ